MEKEKMNKVMKATRRQCLFAMFSALIVVVCVCIGVTMNLTTVYDENFDRMGIRTFSMFTVNSNILAAAGMAMILPYTFDGLRKHNYHLPKWIVILVYAGVTSVTLTFLVSLFILAPVKGFVLIFTGSRFFLHGVCPVLAFVAFCFFMSEQKLSFWDSLLALIPVIIYASLYYIMVAVIGEANGGWEDFYGFLTRIPSWISISLLIPVTLGIATVVRVLHNRSYRQRRDREATYYREVFGDADIRKVVSALARAHSSSMKMRDILIPARVISIMLENNSGNCTMEELCELYLKEYMAYSDVIKIEKMWI